MKKCPICKKSFEEQGNICSGCFNVLEEEKKEFASFLSNWEEAPEWRSVFISPVRTFFVTAALAVLYIYFLSFNIQKVVYYNNTIRWIALFSIIASVLTLIFSVSLGNMLLKILTRKYVKDLIKHKKQSIPATGWFVMKYDGITVSITLGSMFGMLFLTFWGLPKLSSLFFINASIILGLIIILWGFYLGTWLGFFYVGPRLSREWIHKLNY